MRKRCLLSFVMACLLACPPARGTVYNLTPGDDWYGVISGSGLQPGDEVVLGAGTYSSSAWLPMGHQGTAEQPIVIRAAEGAQAIITKAAATTNNIDIMGAQYLTLRGLEITGADAAVRIQKNASGDHAKFVTIEYCHIHHTGGNAITANHTDQTYQGMIFRYNEIDHTGGHGEGFYLGSNNYPDGSTASVFYDGLIEGNYIHDLTSSESIFQGDGIEIKDGSYNNIVRDNVIHDVNYPGIIVYGTDGNAPNIIERNVIWNSGDNGIQAAAEAVIRNNIVLNSAGHGIHSHHHQSAIPGNLTILHNTVISESGHDTVHIYPAEGGVTSGPIVIANNALYNGGSGGVYVPAGTVLAGNVVSSNLDDDFGDVANLDFFPVAGSAVIGAGDAAYAVDDDFNGTPRAGSLDAGAYVFDADGNPGWAVVPGFKEVAQPAPGDANSDGVADGADYTIWADHYLLQPVPPWVNAGWSVGNFNDDDVVDGADYTIWADNYTGGGAIPEPTTLALLAAGAWACLRSTRRRRGRRAPALVG